MRFSIIPFLLLVVPIVEIGAFIAIGGEIGIALTLLMILITAIVGSILLRMQGLSLINKIQTEAAAGRIPGKELGNGAMIVVAGILLLTPGFVTDTIGFLLFVPAVRTGIWNFVKNRINVVVPTGSFKASPFDDQPQPPSGDGPIIDLDADEFSSGTPDPNSPWNKNGSGQ